MKVFCLGGAGMIAREAIKDLVAYSSFEVITIGDFNEQVGKELVQEINDPRVSFVKVNVMEEEETIQKMKGYDVVLDGTTITLNDQSTKCIAKAGCHGVNLNGFGSEDKYSDIFEQHQRTAVPGFGMTPGVTQMMVMHAANQLDVVHSARVSHGSFRPIAFSKSILETTTYEYDPELETRVVYEDGEFKQVPPFSRPRNISLPEPYGDTVQYIIPHSETRTLKKALSDKGIDLIEVRGTWPEKNMRLVRALYDYGILENPEVSINGEKAGLLELIGDYLMDSNEGKQTEVYGYALHAEVVGEKDGVRKSHTLYHTHPASDGSVQGWEGLRAYTRNVGIPLAIATELIAQGKVKQTGVLIPEDAFEPADIFAALEKREIFIHEEVKAVDLSYV